MKRLWGRLWASRRFPHGKENSRDGKESCLVEHHHFLKGKEQEEVKMDIDGRVRT